MGWLSAAGIGLGLSSAFKDSPDTYSPWQQANASWQVNNPNTTGPFGSVNYNIDDMGTANHMRDDVYSIDRQLSPEMQAIADRMLGMVGRGRSTFKGGTMGSKLGSYMNRYIGGRDPAGSFGGAYAFDQGYGPAERRPDEAPDENYDEQALADIQAALGESRDRYGVSGFGGGSPRIGGFLR